jgi:hypothetical protein
VLCRPDTDLLAIGCYTVWGAIIQELPEIVGDQVEVSQWGIPFSSEGNASRALVLTLPQTHKVQMAKQVKAGMSVCLSLITDGKIPDHKKTDSPIGYQFRFSDDSGPAI